MKTVLVILATGIVIWWFVRPGSSGIKVFGGFIGNIIAYIQWLTGQPLIGSNPTPPSL